ncbi:hypothetical protein SAMN06265375_1171 [Muriicola jejuensis]|nr:hypothetical protein SAMN06265375_1171 [Muriicola jejuensis]
MDLRCYKFVMGGISFPVFSMINVFNYFGFNNRFRKFGYV